MNVQPSDRRILILDSAADSWRLQQRALGEAGFQLIIEGPEYGTTHEVMQRHNPDLLLVSAANLFRNGGSIRNETQFEIARIKTALTGPSPVEEYFSQCIEAGVYHYLADPATIEPQDFRVFVENILYPQKAFGLSRYVRNSDESKTLSVGSSAEKSAAIQEAEAFYSRFKADGDVTDVRLALAEIVNNAFYHAFTNADGSEKYVHGGPVELGSGEQVKIEFARNDRFFGCSISDNQGNAEPAAILEAILRQFSRTGLLDTTGRGLFLAHSVSDRMIINLEPRRRFQVVLLFGSHPMPEPKPFFLNIVT